MSNLIIGVGELQVAKINRAERNDAQSAPALVTYALGSCIGLVVYDPVAAVGGLLHYMLPESSLDPEKAAHRPAMFADLGIPLLFRSCYQLGAEKKRMVAYAAGGAQAAGVENTFEIGKRNQLALRKILWKAGVLLRGESLGGTQSRTVRLELGTGRIGLRTGAGAEHWVIGQGPRVGEDRDGAKRDQDLTAVHEIALLGRGRQQP